jgi:hypothetical protein
MGRQPSEERKSKEPVGCLILALLLGALSLLGFIAKVIWYGGRVL